MRVLRVRVIILLSIFYLGLVLCLYHYLWHSHSLDKGLGLLNHLPDNDRDSLQPEPSNGDLVQFNFKRRNGPLQENNGSFEIVWSSKCSNCSNQSLNDFTNTSLGNNNNTLLFDVSNLTRPNYCVHAFYYMWYGNEKVDGRYLHWNHQYIPHWKREVAVKYPQGRHVPPDDIGANFYPELGCYSSKDPAVIEAHMYQLRKAGIGVIAVSWYPTGLADNEGTPPDPLIPILLDISYKYGIQVTLHIEPYPQRNPLTVREDLRYLHETYFSHPAFYKHRQTIFDQRSGKRVTKELPLVYIYDSYHNKPTEWAQVLKRGGASSIRGGDIDCVVIGLLVEQNHREDILNGGFDGFYTYFASKGFSYGANTNQWASLGNFAKEHNLFFIPSFGPGYIDTRVRPWNKRNSKNRLNGMYYRDMFLAAIKTSVTGLREVDPVRIVSLTSFNEWHEGTQIETAVPKNITGFKYLDYSPHNPDYYLELTREVSEQLQCGL